MKSTRVLYVVLAIQSALIGYFLLLPAQPQALAQIPDQGAQLNQLIEQEKALNTKLDRLLQLLESGKLQVRIDKNAK